MRKLIRFLIACLAFAAVFVAIPLNRTAAETIDTWLVNEKTGYRVLVYDHAGLFAEEEIDRLAAEDMYPLTEWGDILLYTTESNTYSDTEELAEALLAVYNNQNATGLIIDMANRNLRIQSSGKNDNKLFSDKAESIADNIFRYASDGEWFECAHVAFNQLYRVNNGQRINQPMKYISAALLAIAVALLGNFIVLKLTTVDWDVNYDDGKIKNGHLDIPDMNIEMINSQKEYSPSTGTSSGGHSSYSSRGRSSGGHSSGGHSSGGGHSF